MLNQRRWAGILVFLLAGPPISGFAGDSSEAKRQTGAPSQSPGKRAIQNEEPEDKKEQDKEEGRNPEASKRWSVYWDEGPRLAALWGQLEMRLGAEVQNDSAAYLNQESVEEIVGEFSGGVEWRRARLYTTGTFHKHFEFKLNYDLAVTSPPRLKDAYFGINKLPFKIPLKVLFGRFQAPLGLEGFTHNTDLTFLERSTMSTAFLPNRNTGILLWDNLSKHRIRWAIGIIEPDDELGVGSSDNLGFSGRFTSAFHAKGDSLLVHTGVDFYRRNVNDTVSFKSRPESHIAPPFVDTGEIAAENVHIGVAEAALQRGPTLFQGEFAYTRVRSNESLNPKFWGFYVEGSHFLTGEIRPYDTSRGAFGRPIPKREFRDGSGGLGALQIAFRFSHIDLTDEGTRGGILDDVSAGLNWYIASYSRVMSNVIWSKLEGAEAVWIFQIRLQVQI
jgi:phosphate-selective porin OprO/OprP